MKRKLNLGGIAGAALLGVLLAAGSASAQTIFWESFEEATLGGSYTNNTDVPPLGANTTGISPSIGTLSAFLGDDGTVVGGLGGSSKALAAYDDIASKNLRLVLFPTANPTNRFLQASFLFQATGPLTGGPLQLLFQTTGGANFLGALVLSDLSFLVTDSTNALFAGGFISSALVTNTEYRAFFDLNLDSYSYDFRITRLSDSSNLVNQTGLRFIQHPSIPTSGFTQMDLQFGYADFGARPASFVIDNILLEIPEPGTLPWFALAVLFILKRRP